MSAPHGNLSPRETEILELLCTGKPPKAIATQLFIANTTVRNHIQSLLRKTGTHSQTQLIANHLQGRPTVTHAEMIMRVCQENGVAVGEMERKAIAEAFSCAHACSVHKPVSEGRS